MSGGHGSHLHLAGDSVLHRMPAECKLAGLLAFVLVVVATPPTTYWAFPAYAGLLAGTAAVAGVPARFVGRRMLVEVPFVLFAVLLPFVARGPRVEVLGLSLSSSGLVSAWGILAKATLGVVASILLAATTQQRDLLIGLERLRMPQLLVQIMAFMFRYAELIGAEMHRMRVARESRGFVGRDVRQLPVVAQAAATLFIRSYERGERVHLAMLSRGYTGSMPQLSSASATSADWVAAAALPVAAMAVAVAGWAL